MGEELDAKVIVETQEMLGKYIKKPPLNEKLLRKPPFKFLHDVITSVINNTGFMKDVFTPDELNNENIKDRDSKIMFLQKAVDYVGSVTKEPLKIRPSKTVAGQEADKTNHFLQAMAKAIESSLQNGRSVDAQEIIRDKKSRSSSQSRKSEAADKTEHKKAENGKEKSKTRSGADESKNVNKSKTEEKKRSDKTKSVGDAKKSLENKRHGDRISHSKDAEKVKEKSVAKDKDPKRTVDDKSSSKDKLKSKGHHKEEESGGRSTAKPSKESRNHKDSKSSSTRRQSITIKSSNEEKDPVVSPKKSPEKRIANGHITDDRAMPAVEVKEEVVEMMNGEQEKRVSETVEQEVTTLQSKNEESGRATTAKLSRSDTMTLMDSAVEPVAEKERVDVTAPPRPSTSTIRKASARPSTARPAAPRVRVVDTAPEEVQSTQISKPVSSIILDGEANKDDEENDIQMEEFSKDKEETSVSLQDLETKDHGSLVTQILETKKDLENGSRIVGASFKQENKTVLSESARRKERDVMAREMEKLREGIQKVTRSANPLGKLIGYLQEDVDIMAREVDVWKLESGKLETELIKEERKSDAELDRLQNQLQELEETIEAQVSEIFTCKSRILRNSDWIKQMISTSI